jgi:hypothetical protein
LNTDFELKNEGQDFSKVDPMRGVGICGRREGEWRMKEDEYD